MCHDVSCVGSPVTKRESFKRFVLSAVYSTNPHSAQPELSGCALSVYSTSFYTSKKLNRISEKIHKVVVVLCSSSDDVIVYMYLTSPRVFYTPKLLWSSFKHSFERVRKASMRFVKLSSTRSVIFLT